MAKAPKWGVNTYHKQKPRKRPGRHSKNPNKKQRKKPYAGQGRGWQISLDILYRIYERKNNNNK